MNPNTFHALAFLSGSCPDDQGRTIDDYLAFSKERWEQCHNHIQWAFPSNIPSEFNKNAPIIDYGVMFNSIFRVDKEWSLSIDPFNSEGKVVIENLMKLTDAYFDSIGISVAGNWVYLDSSLPLYNNPDHNHRRLTRVLMIWHYLIKGAASVDLDWFANFNNIVVVLLNTIVAKRADPYWDTVYEYWNNAWNNGN